MSGIFGLVNLDGAPADPRTIEHMRVAMRPWSVDGDHVVVDGAAGFGHCRLVNSEEAVHERLPARVGRQWLFTAESRIDNRDELCEMFDVPRPQRPTTPDSELIWMAYERWGEACPAHLLGDWSCAVWKPEERRLFLARDHHGMTALYYHADDTRFVFASDKRALLALPGVSTSINEIHLAQVLLVWSADRGQSTGYSAITRLPPAHCLTVEPGTVNVRRFWHPGEGAPARFPRRDDYASALLEHLSTAVRCRMRSRGPMGISLSSGLDSTAVAAVAARQLHASGRTLHTFTSIPHLAPVEMPGRLSNEFGLVSELAGQYTNIMSESVTAADYSPVESMARMLWDVHAEPVHAAGQHYWITAISDAARRRGVRTMLTAQHGNATLSWPGRVSVRSMLEAAGSANPSWVWQECRALLGRCLRRPRAAFAAGWPRGGAPWEAYSFISRDVVSRLSLEALMVERGHDPTFSGAGTDRQAHRSLVLPGADYAGALRAQVGAAFGFEARDPTRDIRLIEFALGLPDHLWRGPVPRWLIRQTVRGVVPDSIRLNRRRGLQAADLPSRLMADIRAIDRVLPVVLGDPAAAALLNRPRLLAFVERLRQRKPVTLMASHMFLRALAVGFFVVGAENRLLVYIKSHETA